MNNDKKLSPPAGGLCCSVNNLPQEFLLRMKSDIGGEFGDFLASYDMPAARGVRANTLKVSAEELKALAPFPLEPVPWCDCGFYIGEERPGKFIEHAAGLYYVQEPSAMCAAPLLKDIRGKNVLDLCSAPGGKGTQLAAQMCGEGVLFLNEIVFSRAKILSQNVERMGVKNSIVTVASPQKLAAAYHACFDAVLVDAPCSGEGMFKKEEAAISEWSAENVTMCALRQAEILESADVLLKAGGSLVYSTCTFSKDEDEKQIERFLAAHKNYTLVRTEKLWPHKVRGEGHFAALLKKGEGEENEFFPVPPAKLNEREKLYRSFEREFLNVRFENLYAVGDSLYSLPFGAPAVKVQTLRAGVKLGDFISGRFVPDHALAMSLKRGEADFVDLDEEAARAYLSGLTFSCDGSGWRAAAYKGYPLGWVKVSGGVAKNHLPKGLRINK